MVLVPDASVRLPTAAAPARPAIQRLVRTWDRPPGFVGWLGAVNHRSVGIRFIVTAFVFFLLAGLQAVVMRVQLAQPTLDLVSPSLFNELFTMHGSAMMFLFAVPMLEGLGIYFVPLMIGARDMAFPRLNAFGYWVYLITGVTMYWSFFTGTAPDAGWFNYPPLSGPGFSPGIGIDYWVTMITFVEISALVAAVEMIVTILKMRAPGMAMHRLPVFVWAMLVTSVMIVFAMPPLMVTSVLLMLDRIVGTHFFHAVAGGNPLLWQHLFWIFGHPDVYIILIPALGILSTIIPVAARRPLAGYVLVITSIVAIGFVSFGLWVHHMFAAGLSLLGMSFFAVASMMISIPSGIQVLSWIATIWRGRVALGAAMQFALGSIVVFLVGGLTGPMLAAVPFDWQVHDSYFVVAHFHYVLIGGAVLPIFAALHFWFPKLLGRMLSERLGIASFWLLFVGINVTFFPLHIVGLLGMPRRVYTYLPGLGWDVHNLISTAGVFVISLGVLVFLVNVLQALVFGARAQDNPWGADTLEWATTSPPPPYNFASIPVVRSRHPLWEQADLRPGDASSARGWLELTDASTGQREGICTTIMDATPDHMVVLPNQSLWPLWLALAVGLTFIGSMVHLALVLVGAMLVYVAILGWTWPRESDDGSGR
jgi:cytochrome c oxidase subunit I+III